VCVCVCVCVCACVSLCTTVIHKTAQNSSDNFPSYPPDNQQSSDDVYRREGEILLLLLSSLDIIVIIYTYFLRDNGRIILRQKHVEPNKWTFSHIPATFSDLATIPVTSFPGWLQMTSRLARPSPSASWSVQQQQHTSTQHCHLYHLSYDNINDTWKQSLNGISTQWFNLSKRTCKTQHLHPKHVWQQIHLTAVLSRHVAALLHSTNF